MTLSVVPDAGPRSGAPRVLVAPDSFGGWRGAPDISRELVRVLEGAGIPARAHPMADGGEGTLDALLAHGPGVVRQVQVPGPLRQPRGGRFARVRGLTLVESATVLGPGSTVDVLAASSFGLGVLLCATARERRGPLVVGLGGSSTVDGGLGLLQALHLTALDAQGNPLPAGSGAGALGAVRRIVGEPVALGGLVAWCDVRTPLVQAAPRFGPQKGLRPHDVEAVTDGLMRLADALDAWRAARGRGALPRDLAGGGAAGGLGYALAALDAELAPGAEAFAHHTGLDAALDGVHTVVLGEGRLDRTSFDGKVADIVLSRARDRGLRVAAVVGEADGAPRAPAGPDAVFAGGPSSDREAGFRDAAGRLVRWLGEGSLEPG